MLAKIASVVFLACLLLPNIGCKGITSGEQSWYKPPNIVTRADLSPSNTAAALPIGVRTPETYMTGLGLFKPINENVTLINPWQYSIQVPIRSVDAAGNIHDVGDGGFPVGMLPGVPYENNSLVMDAGGAPLFVPTDAESFQVGSDGTLSADGQPLGQIGLFKPVEMHTMSREDGVMFRVDGEIEGAGEARVLQGFLEGSNVNAITQVTRMIEIQRAYEMGQSFLETEDQRIRNAIEKLIK